MDTRAHADQWLNAWAARDLDAIMACYSDTVDFAAPTVVTRWGRPTAACSASRSFVVISLADSNLPLTSPSPKRPT